MLRRTLLYIPIGMFATAASIGAQAPAAPAGQAAPARGPASSADGAVDAGFP